MAAQEPTRPPDTPFPDYPFGNILFGGLPLNCGPKALVSHLEKLAALGRQVAPHEGLMERVSSELVSGVQEGLEGIQAVNEIAASLSIERLQNGFANRPRNPIITPTTWVIDETDNLWVDLIEEFGVIVDGERDIAVAIVGGFLLGPPPRTTVDLLRALPKWDRDRWNVPEVWEDSLLARAAAISPWEVLFGVHELIRAPWSRDGGLVVTRGASDEYTDALRDIEIGVLMALVLDDWGRNLHSDLVDLETGIDQLRTLSVPFALPPQIAAMLDRVSRTFMAGEPAVTVILARSSLEAVIKHVIAHRKTLHPPGGLYEELRWLRKEGVLQGEAFGKADKLRLWGNKAAHDDLGMFHTGEYGFASISLLVSVIRALREDLEIDRQ